MGWDVIAGLALQYGLPFVEKLIANWENKTPVTSAEWAALSSLVPDARTQMLAALSRAGIDPNSEQGKALLALLPAPPTPPQP